MLEAMAKGKDVGRLDLHVVGDSLAFTDRGERAEIETILADHRRQLTEYDKRLGRDRSRDDARLLRAAPQARSTRRSRARRRCLQSAARGDHGKLVREPHHPARRDHARSDRASRSSSTRTTRRARSGRRPASRWASEPSRPRRPRRQPGAADGAGAAAGLRRHRRRAAAATRPRSRSGRRPSTRARSSALDAHRPRQGPVVRRLPRDRLPATGRLRRRAGRGADPRFANVGCEVVPWRRASKHLAALDKREDARPRGGPAVGLPAGCHTADVTNGDFDYRKFVQAIVGPGHGPPAGAGPAPSSIVRGRNDDLSPSSRSRCPGLVDARSARRARRW